MGVLSKLFCEAPGGTMYYDVSNSQGKEWLIGLHDMRTAFELYQPTAIKGKALKLFFPYIHNWPFVYGVFHIDKKQLKIRSEIAQILEKAFGEDFCLSFFGGTPCVYQKAVIQIYRNSRILGYCKVSENKDVGALFDRECENLKYLNECGVITIPKVLFRCDIGELKFFCQSSVKEIRGKTVEIITKQHWVFLEDLYKKTVRKVKFEKTDFFFLLESLKKNMEKLAIADVAIIQKSINIIYKENKGTIVEYGFYHGDFTPWNTVFENGQLRVFDFEYAKRTYPAYLDAVHFFMQAKFFIDGVKDSDKIYLDYKQSIIWKRLGDIRALDAMIKYLLEIINLYLSRTEEEAFEEQRRQKTRVNVLRKAIEEYESLFGS